MRNAVAARVVRAVPGAAMIASVLSFLWLCAVAHFVIVACRWLARSALWLVVK